MGVKQYNSNASGTLALAVNDGRLKLASPSSIPVHRDVEIFCLMASGMLALAGNDGPLEQASSPWVLGHVDVKQLRTRPNGMLTPAGNDGPVEQASFSSVIGHIMSSSSVAGQAACVRWLEMIDL